MNMNKIFLFISLLVGYTVSAQNNYIGKSDPEARQILKNVSSKYKNYKSLTSNFTLQVQNSEGKTVGTQSGTIYMKGNKFRINSGDDAIFSDGKTIYNYNKDAREIQLTTFDPKDNTITPQKLFTDFYEKDFLYKLNDEYKKEGKTIQEVELTPTDKTQPYFKIVLNIDKANKSILSSKVFEKNGNRYLYTIKSVTPNKAIAENQFTFAASAYPGVEVIDLR